MTQDKKWALTVFDIIANLAIPSLQSYRILYSS